MAFLDNSGDIILDAVLTDAGRQRMARGNFKITKFAFGDEEINYGVFNASHPSGSAFYDIEVMQTPILEAFTNNSSLMKSKLISMNSNNLLFMPILKINSFSGNNTELEDGTSGFSGGFMLLADQNTERAGGASRIDKMATGILRGQDSNVKSDATNKVVIDQGINSSENGISFKQELSDELVETAYLIKADHRLISLHQLNSSGNGTSALPNQFVDDDGIASYYVALGDGTSCVEGKPGSAINATSFTTGNRQKRANLIGNTETVVRADQYEMFDGPLGSILRLYPRASMHVRDGIALFDEIGSVGSTTVTLAAGKTMAGSAYKFIDTLINIVGVTTGYSIDIPVRLIRKI
tara:strand:+ start:61151 stop:62206 length:1056 start_codon:yes stop_codon:yes gene_type:complete